ncbi:hypothetical protein [Vibrio sp. WXL103]|uniref:hypothetical protein n=1 Tax=Vibrio sp. WXL103 TaxID=3450710 RepID=UPI003EC92C2C
MKKHFTSIFLDVTHIYPFADGKLPIESMMDLALSLDPLKLAEEQERLKLVLMRAESEILELEAVGYKPTRQQLCTLYGTLKELYSNQHISLVQASSALSLPDLEHFDDDVTIH